MNREIDWQAEAVRAANLIGEQLMKAHRGALPWREMGVSVVFGNDGYSTDERGFPREEVEHLRAKLAEAGLCDLGFGVCDEDGYTWVVLVETDDIAALNGMVWESWDAAVGGAPNRDLQSRIADAETIDWKSAPGQRSSLN